MATRSRFHSLLLFVMLSVFGAAFLHAQGLGGAGTVQGVVKDPTGGVMQAVNVTLNNQVTGFKRDTTTDGMGRFVFHNVPPNAYHLAVEVQGFQPFQQDIDVRTAVPIELTLSLKLAGATEAVEVVGHTEDLVERDPTAHTDIDQTLVAKLPLEGSSGLNQIVTLASPGVVSDSNGFFHPIGDHAQTQFSIDNQPVTDQQSRVYSNQISPDAVQSMEVITGVPTAEFGDKSSLVVSIVTKSGLDQTKPIGSFSATYGSFKSPAGDFTLGAGSHTVGDFLSVSGLGTDRFLDPPEFAALHDRGDSQSVFNRLDVHPTDADTLHLNLQYGRSSFDIPNSYDQAAAGQAQHQQINTFNVAPGYSRVFGSKTLLTANAFVRQDRVTFSPSADPFADTPATMSQNRHLTDFGGKVDIAYSAGAHNVKLGGAISGTRLTENFTLGLTDPGFNSPCVDANGDPSPNPALTTTAQCAKAKLAVNDAFIPGLAPFDLSRGGTPFVFNGTGTIKRQSAYLQDNIRTGGATFNLGFRVDHYDGLSTSTLAQPRVGVSYVVPGIGTVLRSSYGRTMETPYNENLLLSSATGANGLADSVFGAAGGSVPLQAGVRDEGEFGVQQGFGRWVVVDVGYFKKHTKNGYDFDVLFDTPIAFPISWDHSNIDGFTGRVNLLQHAGFTAFTVFGHTNAIFSNPENGGLIFNSPIPSGDFRIDHDQKFQQTTNLQYQYSRGVAPWIALTWRYDSGLVAGSVPDFATALTLTADQQAAIGLFCGNTFATPTSPITSCGLSNLGATRLVIPGTPANPAAEDDVANPPRIAPRHVFDVGIGADNVFHAGRAKVKVRFSVVNLTNEQALYNFLSTFSGTHFVTPRAYQVQLGVTF